MRGEISLQLALAEATLADPDADMTALRQMGKDVVAACERQERLLEALLSPAATTEICDEGQSTWPPLRPRSCGRRIITN